MPPRGIPRFPDIVGPTAGGKTALAVQLAHASSAHGIPGEVVTCDAFQIYRGMDIGTAKPTPEDRRGVPHHLLDLRDPGDPEPFTVHDWLRGAEQVIADCRARGRLPIVVGGTNLYVKSLLEGMFEGPGADADIRRELHDLQPDALRAELERIDPATAQRIHANDVRRTVRAIEVFRLTGTPISTLQAQWDREDHRRKDCVLIGLDWPVEAINRRINARVRGMIAHGLEAEVRRLWEARGTAGGLGLQAREALGYKEFVEIFEHGGRTEDAAERIKIGTRQLAKAQRTWLKRLRTFQPSLWIDAVATPMEEWAGLALEACRGE